jgi:hypothetical protein
LVDTVLLAAFAAAYYPLRTGLAVHEWLCLLVIIPSLVHLVVNWNWARRVATSLFGRLRATTRVNFVVDSLLYLSVITVMVSGFVVSRVIGGVLGYEASPYPIWHHVHAVSADVTIVLALVHVALHWRWVVRVAKTQLFAGLAAFDGGEELVPIPVVSQHDGWQYSRRPGYGEAMPKVTPLPVRTERKHHA